MCFQSALAQKKQNTYFLKFNGQHVDVKDSADFIRIIQEPDSGSLNFKVFEYFTNKTLRFLGEASSFEPRLVYEGSSKQFYKSGKQEKIVNYKGGMPVGTSFHFHSNGKLYKVLEYGSEGINVMKASNMSYNYKVKEVYDTSGVALVKGGNGFVTEKDGQFIGEGNYVSGMRDGVWKFTRTGKELTSEETYHGGKFVSGKITHADGGSEAYSSPEVLPEFEGGVKGFNRYLSKKIKFPSDAIRSGIGGIVYVSFVVETDGQLSEIKLLNKLYPSLDKEAIRVISTSPKWIAGREHGIPVRVAFTVPVSYQFR